MAFQKVAENKRLLEEAWVILFSVKANFSFYKDFTNKIQHFTFFSLVLCWGYISYSYFMEQSWTQFLSKNLPKLNSGNIARDSRFLKEHAQYDLQNKSKKKYAVGHPVYGEEQNDQYRVDGSFTSSKGHGSIATLPTSISGNNLRPQRRIPFENPILIDKNDLNPPIPGSEQKLNTPEIKTALDADHQESSKSSN